MPACPSNLRTRLPSAVQLEAQRVQPVQWSLHAACTQVMHSSSQTSCDKQAHPFQRQVRPKLFTQA
eukprot:1161614-Pelagomonas_calceolata.AAC.4